METEEVKQKRERIWMLSDKLVELLDDPSKTSEERAKEMKELLAQGALAGIHIGPYTANPLHFVETVAEAQVLLDVPPLIKGTKKSYLEGYCRSGTFLQYGEILPVEHHIRRDSDKDLIALLAVQSYEFHHCHRNVQWAVLNWAKKSPENMAALEARVAKENISWSIPALVSGSLEEAKERVKLAPFWLDEAKVTKTGTTPLHKAQTTNETALLLEAGVDIVPNRYCETPLHTAKEVGQVRLLLSKGADVCAGVETALVGHVRRGSDKEIIALLAVQDYRNLSKQARRRQDYYLQRWVEQSPENAMALKNAQALKIAQLKRQKDGMTH